MSGLPTSLGLIGCANKYELGLTSGLELGSELDVLPATHDWVWSELDVLPTTHKWVGCALDVLPTTHEWVGCELDVLPTTHEWVGCELDVLPGEASPDGCSGANVGTPAPVQAVHVLILHHEPHVVVHAAFRPEKIKLLFTFTLYLRNYRAGQGSLHPQYTSFFATSSMGGRLFWNESTR